MNFFKQNIILVLFSFQLVNAFENYNLVASNLETVKIEEETKNENENCSEFECVTIFHGNITKNYLSRNKIGECVPKGVMGICLLADGSLVFSSYKPYKGTYTKIWDLNNNRCKKKFKTESHMHEEILLELPNNKLLIIEKMFGYVNNIHIYDINSGNLNDSFELYFGHHDRSFFCEIFIFDDNSKLILIDRHNARYTIMEGINSNSIVLKKNKHFLEDGYFMKDIYLIDGKIIFLYAIKATRNERIHYYIGIFDLLTEELQKIPTEAHLLAFSLDKKAILYSTKDIQICNQKLELEKKYFFEDFEPYKIFKKIIPIKDLQNIILDYLDSHSSNECLDSIMLLSNKKLVKIYSLDPRSSKLIIWDLDSGNIIKEIIFSKIINVSKVISGDRIIFGFDDGSVEMLGPVSQQKQLIEERNNCCNIS